MLATALCCHLINASERFVEATTRKQAAVKYKLSPALIELIADELN
jgi:hypothetical protein